MTCTSLILIASTGPDESSILPTLCTVQLSTAKSAGSTTAGPELSKPKTPLQWLSHVGLTWMGYTLYIQQLGCADTCASLYLRAEEIFAVFAAL